MDSTVPNVLVIDDDEALVRSIIRSLERRDAPYNFHTAHSEREAILLTKRLKPEVILLDLTLDPALGTESGLSLIPKLFQFSTSARIVVLTGDTSKDCGVRAINAGAASFISKPPNIDDLIPLLADAANVSRLMRANKSAEAEMLMTLEGLGLRTKSSRMAETLEQIAFAAATPLPVILCGETGVGKGVVAQAIHQASKRASGPFVRLQPHFGSHDLIMAELFGHTRGAFTGARDARLGLIEEAGGGTLFLDEIDTLPNQTQVSLLHVLQEKEFQKIGSSKMQRSDFRLISATNRPFESLICGDGLRNDFFHRVAHTVIHIPSLRERREDISLLATHFVDKFVKESGDRHSLELSNEAKIWLSTETWPGNIREL